MRYGYLTLALLALAITPAKAQVALEISSNAAIVGDCGSTLYALHHDKTLGETNILMPSRPTTGTVLFWCGMAVGANEGLTRFLFPKGNIGRKIVWGAVTMIEGYAFTHNLKVGGVIRF